MTSQFVPHPPAVCENCEWWTRDKNEEDEGTCSVKNPGKVVCTTEEFKCRKFEYKSNRISRGFREYFPEHKVVSRNKILTDDC